MIVVRFGQKYISVTQNRLAHRKNVYLLISRSIHEYILVAVKYAYSTLVHSTIFEHAKVP